MNNFLAKTLASINALIAVVILAFFTLSGAASAQGSSGMFVIGAIFGAIGGIVIAALVCGAIAFLVLIERHLSVIAAAAKQSQGQ